MRVDFLREVRALLRQVPRGRVTSFKAVAEALGDVRAAKAVRQVLREARPEGWHRVVRADGGLSFPEARAPLQEEGVPVTDGRVEGFTARKLDALASTHPLRALREEQRNLARRVRLEDAPEEGGTVAGFDVAYEGERAYAAAVVVAPDSLEVLQQVALTTPVTFPYVPTYLAHREWGPLARCYERLEDPLALLLVDGNGILHPARFGIACLVGVRTGRPTVGVAKSLLLGEVAGAPGPGEAAEVRHQEDILGYAFRPAEGKPIYISPGHRISLATALERVRGLCRQRIPEPLRLAHRACSQLRREGAQGS